MKCSVYLAFLGILTVSSAAVGQCTPNWFISMFVITVDQIASFEDLQTDLSNPDSELSYFRETLRFSEEEIEQATQDAIDFYNERYGLDFSGAPDERNVRHFENSTLIPIKEADEAELFITYNRWIVSGNTRSRCSRVFQGGYVVGNTEPRQQLLHGTYGGEQGILVTYPESVIFWGYFSIETCPQEPLVIQANDQTPFRRNVDGFFVHNQELYHRQLGKGAGHGIFTIRPHDENGNVHQFTRLVMAFPGHPALVP